MPEKKIKTYDVARLIFWATVAFCVFLLGGVFGSKALQPYQLFEDGYKATRAIIKEQFQTRPHLLRPRRSDADGVTLHNRVRAYKGLTLMQGLFPEGVELRLVDMTGRVVHRWPIDFFRIWPNPKHVIPTKNVPKSEFHYHTQGMWALPNGSVVFNIGEIGTVKMDKCGTVEWTIDRMTHHVITPNADGSFWIPVKGDVRDVPDALLLPGLSLEDLMDSEGQYEDRLILVDPVGQIKHEILVLQALFEGGFERELFDVSHINNVDPTHLNDIEVVTSTLAEKIDGVEEGDLLISLRQMHMLAIIDQNTGRFKWHHIGPWVRQHDPDITPEGNIVVFNNGTTNISSDRVPGSNLIMLDPVNGQTNILYPHAGQQAFYTDIMGDAQALPNGNRLIVESRAGRIIEIDGQGNIVWEYIKPYDDTHASLIEGAIRYDRDYFTVNDWNCS